MDPSRLEQQLTFIKELDQLKLVQRKSFVSGTRRLETSAEHSWHVAVMAWLLCEHAAPPGVDGDRVLKMLLIHDVVEIDAGDTLLYAEAEAQRAQHERELAAADRLFGLLPEDQGPALRALWDEFEERATAEAAQAERDAALLEAACQMAGHLVVVSHRTLQGRRALWN